MNNVIIQLSMFCSVILWSCSTSQKNEESDTIKRNIELKKSLPVGMVDATILFNEIYTLEGKTYTKAEMLIVHEYGNSVGALSEKVNYEFEISEEVIKESNSKDLIGEKYRCRLMKLPGTMDRTAPDKFKIVSIDID